MCENETLNVGGWMHLKILIKFEHVSDEAIANPSRSLNGDKSFGKRLSWSKGLHMNIRWQYRSLGVVQILARATRRSDNCLRGIMMGVGAE